MKKTIMSHITKFSSLMFIFIAVSLLVILSYSFYKSYANNLKLLEDQLIENYISTIKKRNYNMKLLYLTNYKVALENKKNDLKNRVYLAYSLLQNIYYSNVDKKDINEIKREALRILNLIRFDNGKGFYNIFNSKGFRVNSQFNCVLSKKDEFKEVLKKIVSGESGFYTVEWENNEDDRRCKKIIYGIYFEQFDWIILTGFFKKDLIQQVNTTYLANLKRMKFPKYIGLIVFNKKNIPIFWPEKTPKIFIDKLKKVNVSGITELNASGLHYAVVKDVIDKNGWRIFTFFVKENVAFDIQGVKSRLFNFFILQVSVVILFVMGVFGLFVFYLRRFNVKLNEQLSYFIEHIKNLPYQYQKIDTDKLEFLELAEIGDSANKMVDTIKELNESLKKEKNFLDAILTHLPYGVGVIDKNFTIEYANEHALKMIKVEKDVIGKNLYDLVPKGFDRGDFIFAQLLDEVNRKRSELIIEKIKLIRGDGVTIYAHMAIAPIFDSDRRSVEKYVVLFYDITDELKLKQKLMTLTRAVESAPVSVVITDTNFKIEYVNAYFEEITGYSLEEVKGKSPKIIGTEHNEKFYENIKDNLLAGKSWKGEFLNKKKDGTTYWEQAFISPVVDEKGKVVNYVAVKEDISERKKFIQELQVAKEKAEIANRAKSQFLANMSHEIRTPMNAIIGFIDLLLQTELNEVQKRYLELINESTNNLLRILNDILDISKFESKGIDFEDKPFSLKKVVSGCGNIFSSKIKEKKLDFEINIDKRIPEYLIGDSVRIGQVLNNLLNNAVKFTSKGFVKLDVSFKGYEDGYALIEVCVEDSGVGIPKEKHELIFDAFTQADSSVTRKFGGTGLGLAIAKKIVEYYGGKIWVESDEGKGARFCFNMKLRVADKLVYFEKEEEKTLDFESDDVRVLVAEDHYTNQILMKELFKAMNVNVTIVNNGKEAIEELAKNYYDIVFMDWHMPEMDGVEALEILRMLENKKEPDSNKIEKELIEKLKGKKFIIVALTAAGMKEEREELLKKGFDDYLLKPIEKDSLYKVLTKYLKHFKEKKVEARNVAPDYNHLKSLVGEDEDVINRLISSFKNTFETAIESLKKAVEDNDFDEISKIAHTLKGAAGNLGFTEISELSLKIEKAIKKGAKEDVAHLVQSLFNIKID